MSFGFNKNFKKDEEVVKLKALAEKDVKAKTRQLEVEKRRMEERLQELKSALQREKQERANKSAVSDSNGFWEKGAKGGPVANHAQNFIANIPVPPPGSDISKAKVVLLKDESATATTCQSASMPRAAPEPGTLAAISRRSATIHPAVRAAAARNLISEDGLPIGSCGQCETQLATIHCQECCENFCRNCHQSFHMKGALKQHTSVPVNLALNENGHTKRGPPPPSSNNSDIGSGGSNNKKIVKFAPMTNQFPLPEAIITQFNSDNSPQPGDEQQPFHDDSNMASIDIFEEGNLFANEWSRAVAAVAKSMSGVGVEHQKTYEQKLSLSCGTSTDFGDLSYEHQNGSDNNDKQIVIRFSNSEMSYKDRLLLNKYRRFELLPAGISMVPKPPTVTANKPLRLSRDALNNNLRMPSRQSTLIQSMDAENFADLHRVLDFCSVEKALDELVPSRKEARPLSVENFDQAFWQNEWRKELDDDEILMQFTDNHHSADKCDLETVDGDNDDDYVEDVIEIRDLSEALGIPPPPKPFVQDGSRIFLTSRHSKVKKVDGSSKPQKVNEVQRTGSSFSLGKQSALQETAVKLLNAAAKQQIEVSSNIGDILMMGVAPKPETLQDKVNVTQSKVDQTGLILKSSLVSSGSWKPLESSVSGPVIRNLRFPANISSTDPPTVQTNKSKSPTIVQLSTSIDSAIEQKSGGGFAGRHAKAKVPIAASRERKSPSYHGYQRPRSALRESIENWRASLTASKVDEVVKSHDSSLSSSSNSTVTKDNDGIFCGKLAAVATVNNSSRPSSAVRLASINPFDDDQDGNFKIEEANEDAAMLESLADELLSDTPRNKFLLFSTNAADEESVEIQGGIEEVERLLEIEEQNFECGRLASAINDEEETAEDLMALGNLAVELSENSATTAQLKNFIIAPKGSLTLTGAASSSMTSVTSTWTGGIGGVGNSIGNNNPTTFATVATSLPSSVLPEVAENFVSSSLIVTTPNNMTLRSRSRGNYALRQSSIMDDFDDMEKQLDIVTDK